MISGSLNGVAVIGNLCKEHRTTSINSGTSKGYSITKVYWGKENEKE